MENESNGIPATMLVSPSGNGGFGNGFGGDWAWILLLLVLFGGNGFGGWGGGFGGGELYPWLNNSQNINGGFRDQMLNGTLGGIQNSVTAGFGDMATALCGGFAGVNAAITNAQMANLERSYAAQTASTQGMTALQSQLASCCCDNRLATANLTSTVLSENCADRAALSDGIRDIITNATQNTQRILDQLCADKIDSKNERIAELERQLTLANLAASQGAQTAAIIANNEAQTTALEQYLAPVPRPAYIVQNPNCCGTYNACGCGV